jgi:uroporphyrinogen decarboxylase
MTPRERVYATLSYSHPDRAPRDLWVLPYVQLFRKAELDEVLRRFPIDFDRPELSPGSDDADLRKYSRAGKYVDEWGSVWHLAEPGIVGEVKEPVLSDWSRLPRFRPPWDFIRGKDWAHVDRVCRRSDKFMLSGVCARPFERLQFLRGTENLYIDLAYDTPELRTLLGMVHDYYLEDVANWARSEVDAVALMDDWGSNTSLLISPELWRGVFKPLYKDYCDIIHGRGKKVFFHSDGNIEAIYGDLIEVGIDALNSQLFCMDIERLGKRYAGHVTFWGEIDRQQVLPYGTDSDVRAAVHRVRRALEGTGGGVIAQCEWGKDNSRQNVEAVFRAWEEPLP